MRQAAVAAPSAAFVLSAVTAARAVALAILALAVPTVTAADGSCATRPPSAAERAFLDAAHEAARRAMPAPPPGWEMKETAATHLICVDATGPVFALFRYRYHDAAAERRRDEAAAALRRAEEAQARQATASLVEEMKGTPEQRARIAEIDAALAPLERDRSRAKKGGDARAVAVLDRKIGPLRDERSRIETEATIAAVQRIAARSAPPASPATAIAAAEIEVRLNDPEAAIPLRATPVVRAAVDSGIEGQRATVLVGRWSRTRDGRWRGYDAAFEPGAPAARAQTIAVRVLSADRATDAVTLERLARGIDVEPLRAIAR